ncbi:DUF2507 domain-containing protein [Bacillus piscicola]|uniref:DUF2507 domain-containing protein n=1 Tax=Bacillus piscicola TaxID=1632684 RepID=UPI001F095D5E|nr:DUF2507 domain-containing protein [Bacillus piscicola]
MKYPELSDTDFSYALLRHFLLPELLGSEKSEILYWAGKAIARQYPANSIDAMVDFFQKARWGDLRIAKEKSRSLFLELRLSQTVKHIDDTSCFHLEAGYLAEQIETLKGKAAETCIFQNKNIISFQVQWDR